MMMKKILMLVAAAACIFATACEKEEQPVEEYYYLVSTPMPGSRFAEFSDTEMRFRLVGSGANVYTLEMNKVKFVDMMPLRVDITVDGIVLDGAGRYAADSVIPKYNGEDYPQYELSNLTLAVDRQNNLLSVSFDCFTMHVKYTGTLLMD